MGIIVPLELLICLLYSISLITEFTELQYASGSNLFNTLRSSDNLAVAHHIIFPLCSYEIMCIYLLLWFIVVVIGFPMGASLTATERINTTVNVCPQILQGVLERPVSVYATSVNLSAMGNCDTESIDIV